MRGFLCQIPTPPLPPPPPPPPPPPFSRVSQRRARSCFLASTSSHRCGAQGRRTQRKAGEKERVQRKRHGWTPVPLLPVAFFFPLSLSLSLSLSSPTFNALCPAAHSVRLRLYLPFPLSLSLCHTFCAMPQSAGRSTGLACLAAPPCLVPPSPVILHHCKTVQLWSPFPSLRRCTHSTLTTHRRAGSPCSPRRSAHRRLQPPTDPPPQAQTLPTELCYELNWDLAAPEPKRALIRPVTAFPESSILVKEEICGQNFSAGASR